MIQYLRLKKQSNEYEIERKKDAGKVFKLKQKGTNVKTEVVAGITIFMTMAYILAVNPSVLGDTADVHFGGAVRAEIYFPVSAWFYYIRRREMV